MELRTTGQTDIKGFRRDIGTAERKLNIVTQDDKYAPEFYMDRRQKKYWNSLPEEKRKRFVKSAEQRANGRYQMFGTDTGYVPEPVTRNMFQRRDSMGNPKTAANAAGVKRPADIAGTVYARNWRMGKYSRNGEGTYQTCILPEMQRNTREYGAMPETARPGDTYAPAERGKKAKTSGKTSGKATGKAPGEGQAAIETAKRTAQEVKRSFQMAVHKEEEQRNYHSSAIMSEESGSSRTTTVRPAETAMQKAVISAIVFVIAAMKSILVFLAPIFLVVSLILSILAGIISCFLFGSTVGGYAKANVSAECEQYRPLVQQYASMYGIPEYVELILAVMMQESGGTLPDVMQAAEGAFNTRYPNVPNGITDPEYSIECGVQELKRALEMAGATGPTDTAHISLALQGYNFGEGYITWAMQNYGGYSEENAAEFSDMMAARMGWSGYGDKQYVPHVLRYYEITGGLGNVPAGGMQIPLYDQKDYADVPFGGGSIATSGCAPTSFAMVASYLLEREVTPVEAMQWCGNAYYVPGAGTGWDYFPAAASHFGIRLAAETGDPNAVLQALSEGKPVISSQGPGLFTANGHFIVLRGVTEGGAVLVNDPNDSPSKGYANRAFDMMSEIHATSRMYWIFDR